MNIAWLKVAVFAAALVPAVHLAIRAYLGDLGAEPVKELIHVTGDWGLRFLLITLAVTPLRRLTGRAVLLRFRRMLGLFAFFYACLHVLIYLGLEHFFDWSAILEDFFERIHITAGLLAFLMLIPLAVTSTNAMIRRLGRRWKTLHQLVYPATALAVLHFALLVKKDLREPLIYAAILAVLLGSRWFLKPRPAR